MIIPNVVSLPQVVFGPYIWPHLVPCLPLVLLGLVFVGFLGFFGVWGVGVGWVLFITIFLGSISPI